MEVNREMGLELGETERQNVSPGSSQVSRFTPVDSIDNKYVFQSSEVSAFEEGDKVLCYHLGLLYEAKVLKRDADRADSKQVEDIS